MRVQQSSPVIRRAQLFAFSVFGLGFYAPGHAQQFSASGFDVLTPVQPAGGFTNFGYPTVPTAIPGNLYIQAATAVNGFSTGTIIINDSPNARFISLDQFATSMRSQQDQQTQTRIEQLAFFARRDFQRLNEGIALSSALTIMPPNPGDRFAVTVGGAGFNGRGAGAITGTYRVNESTMVFGGYARSETQNLVKGGATFSFR